MCTAYTWASFVHVQEHDGVTNGFGGQLVIPTHVPAEGHFMVTTGNYVECNRGSDKPEKKGNFAISRRKAIAESSPLGKLNWTSP